MIDLFKSFFKGKKILVTGHTGFKGSWLSLWLSELGAEVVGYALNPLSTQDNYALCNLDGHLTSVIADVRSKDELKRVFKTYNPEIVFHLAAQAIVSEAYCNPYSTYEINVLGTLNVLEQIRQNESTKLGIIITSDKCYKNKEWVYGYRENDELGGDDPYSASKACKEILVSSYRKAFLAKSEGSQNNKLIITTRSGNVIGGGDWAKDRIIPDCIRAVEKNEKVILRNPTAIRPWQHVLEPIYGYLTLAAKSSEIDPKIYVGAWNFGPDFRNVVPVEALVQKVLKYWGSGSYVAEQKKEKIHETRVLNLDSTKSKNYLKWQPVWDIEKTVEKTVEWYKHYGTKDVEELCLKQIEAYCKDAKEVQKRDALLD